MGQAFSKTMGVIALLGILLIGLSFVVLGFTSGFFMGIVSWVWGLFVWWGLTFMTSPLWIQVLMTGVTLFVLSIISVPFLIAIDESSSTKK